MLFVFRNKLSQTQSLTLRKFRPSLEAYKELSSQEMELTRMHKELEQNRSLLQLLLQNCPDSVHHLLDRFRLKWIHRSAINIPPHLWTFQLYCGRGKQFCPLWLLPLSPAEWWPIWTCNYRSGRLIFILDDMLSPFSQVVDNDRKKLLEHPLFEAFIQLKWLKLSKIHLATFLFFLLHLLAITLFALTHFGSFQMDAVSKQVFA